MKMRLAAVAAVVLTAFGAGAEVKVSALFGPGMVLQRGVEVPVWGKADPGEKVKVEFAGKAAEAVADANGDWLAKLPPLEGSREGRDLTVTSQTSQTPQTSQTFPDVLVGDVFLYGGGNEALAAFDSPWTKKLRWDKAGTFDAEAAATATRGDVRIFLHGNCTSSIAPTRFAVLTGKWHSAASLGKSTLINPWFFAKAWTARTGLPCGFISIAYIWRFWEYYMTPDAFAYFPGGLEYTDGREFVDTYFRMLRSLADFGGRTEVVCGAKDDVVYASDDSVDVKLKFGNHGFGMVDPVLKAAFLGAIWIDTGRPGYFEKKEYEDILAAMFCGWRDHAGRDFACVTLDRKSARDKEAARAVKAFAEGAAPAPLKKVFELKEPGPTKPSWGEGFAVSKIFGDHMVLQHGKKHPVWGKGRPGEKVTVSYGGASATAVTDAKGDWEAVLPPLEIRKEGTDLAVKGETGSAVFHDVLCGDVWYSAGQSNAEMSFNWGCIRGDETIAESSQYPNIRYTKFDHLKSLVPVKFQTCNGPWKVCDTNGLGGCSAMGYYFARRINIETGIPVGILDNNWSGSAIEPFIPVCGMRSEKLTADKADVVLKVIERTVAAGRRASGRLAEGKGILEAFADDDPFWPSAPDGWCGQWNIMNEPIIRLPFTGITWYQGCSNKKDGKNYRDLMRALVKGWRAKYGFEMPFYQVMLASFTPPKEQTPEGGDGYAEVREAQREVNDMIPNFGTALALDVGNPNDIHPKNKMDVGERLALWALRDVYGKKGVVVSGPWYEKMTLEGAKARIHFRLFGSKGLVAADKDPDGAGVPPVPTPDGKLKGFSLQDADGKWHFADAAIDGETVVVSSPEVKEAKNVRYAYRMHTIGNANLYNAEGLPALPFKTDAW